MNWCGRGFLVILRRISLSGSLACQPSCVCGGVEPVLLRVEQHVGCILRTTEAVNMYLNCSWMHLNVTSYIPPFTPPPPPHTHTSINSWSFELPLRVSGYIFPQRALATNVAFRDSELRRRSGCRWSRSARCQPAMSQLWDPAPTSEHLGDGLHLHDGGLSSRRKRRRLFITLIQLMYFSFWNVIESARRTQRSYTSHGLLLLLFLFLNSNWSHNCFNE